MVELADTSDLGSDGRTPVEVRVLLPASYKIKSDANVVSSRRFFVLCNALRKRQIKFEESFDT